MKEGGHIQTHMETKEDKYVFVSLCQHLGFWDYENEKPTNTSMVIKTAIKIALEKVKSDIPIIYVCRLCSHVFPLNQASGFISVVSPCSCGQLYSPKQFFQCPRCSSLEIMKK